MLAVLHQDRARIRIKADGRIVITNAADGFACDLRVIDFGTGGDLTREYHQIVFDQRFSGDARALVLRKQRIQHGIGNGVRDFIRMAFGNGLRGKQEIAHGDEYRLRGLSKNA